MMESVLLKQAGTMHTRSTFSDCEERSVGVDLPDMDISPIHFSKCQLIFASSFPRKLTHFYDDYCRNGKTEIFFIAWYIRLLSISPASYTL